MKKGIIMEIDESFLTLLTPEGEFLHAKRQNQTYSIGEEIHFFPIEMVKTSNSLNPLKNIFRFKPVMGLMAALVIFLGTLIPMYQNNKAYAYMSIDVNPSIEMVVNKKMQVVEMTGFNQEGKKIISRMDNWEKKDVSEIAKTIIAEIKKDGFLKTKENVIISTVQTKEPEVRVEKKLQETIEEIKTTANKQKLEVTVLKATEKELEKAHKLGITTGKYQSKELTSKEKAKEEQTDKKAVPVSPKNQLSTSEKQIQIKKVLIQKNKDVEPKSKTETNHVDRKIISPGQLKKIEVNQRKQTTEQHKKQNEQKGKKSENKKTKSSENQISKVIKKQPGKSNKEKKGKNIRNSSQKSKDKHSKKAYGKNDNNPKSK